MTWTTCGEGRRAGGDGRYAEVCLTSTRTADDLAQATPTLCGPTCVLHLALGGALAPRTAPSLHGKALTRARVEWITDHMRRRVRQQLGVGPGDVEELAREFAAAWGGRLELWRVHALDYASAGTEAAWLDVNVGPFLRKLEGLLRRSPRGVACQYVITDGRPTTAALAAGVASSHWVVARAVDASGDVTFYDPDLNLRHHLRRASGREFLAGHVKGCSASVANGTFSIALDGERTRVVAAGRDKVHRPIRAGAPLFQLDPSAWPFDGRDLTAQEAAWWTSDFAVADARAGGLARAGRATVVIEFGEHDGSGSFAVVPVAEALDAAVASAGMLDPADSPPRRRALPPEGEHTDASPLQRGSVVLFAAGGGAREVTTSPRSHRRLAGDPG